MTFYAYSRERRLTLTETDSALFLRAYGPARLEVDHAAGVTRLVEGALEEETRHTNIADAVEDARDRFGVEPARWEREEK